MTVDDRRIQELTEEVLNDLAPGRDTGDIERRVEALERALGRTSSATSAGGARHIALRVIDVATEAGPGCVLEPGKPCDKSGRCRSFGY